MATTRPVPVRGRVPRARPTAGAIAVALGIVAVILLAWAHAAHPPPSRVGDFYPLYHGARALLTSGDAYHLDPGIGDFGAISRAGNAYPLPAVLALGLPLSWAPPALAGTLWVAVLGLAWVAAIRWARESWAWLLWWPMWEALRIGQPTAAVAVAAIAAVGALRRDNRAVFLMALVVLSTKPQQTALLVVGLVWWGRHWWRWIAGTAVATAIVSLAAQPDWPTRWWGQLDAYRAAQDAGPALAPALLVVAAWLFRRGWRESALAVSSNAVGMWPTAAHYNAALWPLGLSDRAGLAAAAGAAIGFLAVLLVPIPGGFPTVLLVSMVIAAGAFPRPAPSRPAGRQDRA